MSRTYRDPSGDDEFGLHWRSFCDGFNPPSHRQWNWRAISRYSLSPPGFRNNTWDIEVTPFEVDAI